MRLLTSHSRLKRRNSSSLSNFDFCSGTTRGILKKNLGFGCSYNPIVSYGIIPAKSFIILITFVFFSTAVFTSTRIKSNEHTFNLNLCIFFEFSNFFNMDLILIKTEIFLNWRWRAPILFLHKIHQKRCDLQFNFFLLLPRWGENKILLQQY